MKNFLFSNLDFGVLHHLKQQLVTAGIPHKVFRGQS
jgi:hypothetical protein